MTPYALALEITLVVAVWLSLTLLQRDPATPGRRTFVLLALACAAWCIGELVVARGVDEIVGDRIKYAGALALPPLWLGLATHAARMDIAARVPWFPLVLMAPMLFAYALLYVDSWGCVFVTVIEGGNDLYGPMFWIAALYNYALVAVGSVILMASAVYQRASSGWIPRLLLGLGALVPLGSGAAYLASGGAWSSDPTPALLGVALIALHGAVFDGGMLQLLPVSQLDLLQQLPFGMVLTDRHGTVLALNPRAEARLGVARDEAVGRDLDALLEHADEPPRLERSPILSLERELGQLVLLDRAPEKPEPEPLPPERIERS